MVFFVSLGRGFRFRVSTLALAEEGKDSVRVGLFVQL